MEYSEDMAPKTAEEINRALTGRVEVPAVIQKELPRGITTMPSALLVLPQAVMVLVGRAVEMANGLVIEDDESYESSMALLKVYEQASRQIEALTKDNIKRWFDGHRAATKQRADLSKPFELADKIVKEKRAAYREEFEKKKKEQERLNREQAKKDQVQAAQEQAERLTHIGETEQAAAVIEMAQKAPAPVAVVETALPKAKGEVHKQSWGFRIINPDLIKREFLLPEKEKAMDPNEYPFIKKTVNAIGKLAENAVGGIEVFQTSSEFVRLEKQ